MESQHVSKKTVAVICLCACVLAAFIGVAFTFSSQAAETGEYTVSGVIECKEINVRAKIAGYLTEIPIVEGQEVAAGDFLFSSDRRDVEVKLVQAQGAADAYKAQLEKALNGARSQDVTAAAALAEKAHIQVNLLQEEYDKYKVMYEMTGGLSDDNMSKLTAQLDAAKSDAAAADAQYQMAIEGARAEDVKAAQAQYDAAMGVVAEVQLNLDQTSQYAPCAGTVTMISSEVGELIGSGTPIVTITDYTDRWIYANVDETHLGSIEIGQKVSVFIKAYPDQTFTGTVTVVSKNPDFATKKSTNELNDKDIISYQLKIVLDDQDVTLYPGMLVDVSFDKAVDAQ